MGMNVEDSNEGFSLRKKIFPGTLDVHPTENAIIVNYTVQATILGEDGQPVAGDKKEAQKVIRIKILSPSTNISALAQEVVEKCKLIHQGRVDEVEQLLYYLQQRQESSPRDVSSSRAQLRKQVDEVRKSDMDFGDDQEFFPPTNEVSSMDDVETYIEGLYEEIPEKVQSTRRILQLARNPEYMSTLIENESLMSALSRVLREDGRRSMELVTNIIYIFFCFSNYSEFHPILTSNKIGDMCLRITDQELKRFDLWVTDLQKLDTKSSQSPTDRSVQSELQKEKKKFQKMLLRQDQLLFVTFHLLLNMAEDLNIELKMVKRDIIAYLLTMLDRKTPELLILSLTFLKKLSVFRENKDEMVKNPTIIIDKLGRLLDSDIEAIQGLVLRLLLNLSHDSDFRFVLCKEGFPERLSKLIESQPEKLAITVQLLYQLSSDDKGRQSQAFLDCIPQVIKLILESKGDSHQSNYIDILSLGINFSTVPKYTQMIMQDNGIGFKFLMKKAVKTRDPLLFKMIRNISQSGDINVKMRFLDYIDDVMKLLLSSVSNPDLLVELLGILGNLAIPQFNFSKLAEAYNLVAFLQKMMSNAVEGVRMQQRNGVNSGDAPQGLAPDDDILLECVILLGTMGLDETFAPVVVDSNLLDLLIDIMVCKEEDDEMILQVCYCIHQYMLYPITKKLLMSRTQVVGYLIDLLYDRNVEIRKMCDAILSLIAETDEEWETKLRQQKFTWHNAEWIGQITKMVPGSHSPEAYADPNDNEDQYNDDFSDHRTRAYGRIKNSISPGLLFGDESDDEDAYRGSIGGSNARLDAPA